MQKKLIATEIGGIVFGAVLSLFLQNLHTLSDRGLIGVLFGAVNNSIWETLKTLLLPYLLWAMLEVLCIKPRFHKFAAAKIICLYVTGVVFIGLELVLSLFSTGGDAAAFAAVVVCLVFAAVLSEKLYFSLLELEKLFVPLAFMLLLFVAFFCSFTPFPPHNIIFEDRATGLYGIIPEYIDKGASALDAIYFL